MTISPPERLAQALELVATEIRMTLLVEWEVLEESRALLRMEREQLRRALDALARTNYEQGKMLGMAEEQDAIIRADLEAAEAELEATRAKAYSDGYQAGIVSWPIEAVAEVQRWQGVVADIVAAVPIDPVPFYEKHGIPTCLYCTVVIDADGGNLCGDCWQARNAEPAPVPGLCAFHGGTKLDIGGCPMCVEERAAWEMNAAAEAAADAAGSAQ